MATDYYVSQVDGNDSYNGEYPTFQGGSDGPWLTWDFVRVQSFVLGDTIGFRRGGNWAIGNNDRWEITDSGTEGNEITIYAYDSGAKPIFDCEDEFNGKTWTEEVGEGTDIWSTPFAVDVYRVRLDGDDSYTPATAAEVNSSKYLWHWNTTDDKLFVYSPQNPNSEYTNIKVTHANRRVFLFNGCNYIKIQDVEMRGGTYTFYCNATADESYITLENCDIYYFYNGIVFPKTPGGGGSINNGTIDGCDIDAKLNLISTSGYPSTERCCYDLIRWESEVDDWVVKNSTFAGGGHAHIMLKTTGTPTQGVRNNIFEHNIFDGTGTIYVRAVSFDDVGDTDKLTGNIFRYNIEKNTNIRSQIDGYRNEVYYNLIYDKVVSPATNHTDDSEGFSMVGHENKFYNNVVYGIYNEGFYLGADAYSNLIKNNIFMDCGKGGDKTNICFYAISGIGANNVIEYNNFYDVGTSDVINYKGTVETVAEADAGRSEFANNMSADPLFVNAGSKNFHLQSGSPCRDAGVDVGLTEDYEGNIVPQGIGFDMGAYEYLVGILSDDAESKLLAHIFKNTQYTQPGNIYVALCKSTIEDDDTGSTLPSEVSGGSYARKQCNTWDTSGVQGHATNDLTLLFAEATAEWGTITDFAICDALSGGNVICYGKFTTARNVGSGDQFIINTNDLDVTWD